MIMQQMCRECGCTDDNACVDEEGTACHWVEPDLCSACHGKTKVTPDRVTIYSTHPLYPVLEQMQRTEMALVKARAETKQWQGAFYDVVRQKKKPKKFKKKKSETFAAELRRKAKKRK